MRRAVSSPARPGLADRRVDERGQGTVEFVIVAAVLLVLIFTVVSYAIYYQAETVVQGAARVGARAGAAAGAGPSAGRDAANSYLDAVAPTLVEGRSVQVSISAQSVTVRVEGTAKTPLAGIGVSLHATSTQIIERFRPDR
jgi:Flp pilus assembly protein TadG